MATIVQQSQGFPVTAQAAPQAAPEDPLFEALVKYITSGSDAQPTTADEINSIIESHSEPSSRAYLQELVTPDPVLPARVWKQNKPLSGNVVLNKTQLQLKLKFGVGWGIMDTYTGEANGLFMPQTLPVQGVLHFDNDADVFGKADFTITSFLNLEGRTLWIDWTKDGKHVAQTVLPFVPVRGPFPQKINGTGGFAV